VKKLRLAGIADYDEANAYLDEPYLADHNRRYAHAAAAPADYHRRRPTARQLDEIFCLEEERVVSEDWVVRYQNRLLQLERAQPTQDTGQESRVRAGKPSGGSGHSLSRSPSGVPRSKGGFYRAELGKGRCPFPRAPIPETATQPSSRQSSLETRLPTEKFIELFGCCVKHNQGTFLVWRRWGHF